MHDATIEAALDRASMRWAHGVGTEVTNAAREIITEDGHVDEGRMRAAVDYAVRRGNKSVTTIVGCDVDYAVFFHTGTGIHGPHGTPIVPVSAKALRFEPRPAAVRRKTPRGGVDARYIFRRSVQGMERSPFMVKALHRVIGDDSLIRDRTP
ncbi:hypothetical protein OG579_17115 [Williamsia herbipolensis]|uniref:Uncharacterized protein n=1 Tax=Williamsia herbipolensis TaxID=1603258 RepID=A0AAU4K048_9NOCA|nr:hypothetical protein [Williamsia herbipolensis]